MECRICLDDCEQNDMISPCLCREQVNMFIENV